MRRLFLYGLGGLSVALLGLAFATCSTSGLDNPCPTPAAGSEAGSLLADARSEAPFAVLYPCQLPAGEQLVGETVTGPAGRQQAELVFAGPFDLTLRQSQYPPPTNPDPTGASRSEIDLFPNVRAILLEVNDGTRKALYHLFWERDGLFYELQAVGPPLQRRQILQVATSLE